MTTILSVDPGLMTGAALGYYSAIEPYRLIERWQIGNGLEGFLRWMEQGWMAPDEIVVEKFIYVKGADADISGVPIEGALALQARLDGGTTVIWHDRTDKAALTGIPESATTKAQRQRVRFDFLDRLGLFMPGTSNDDSNDAIIHALVSLRRRRHMPTLRWLYGKEGE